VLRSGAFLFSCRIIKARSRVIRRELSQASAFSTLGGIVRASDDVLGNEEANMTLGIILLVIGVIALVVTYVRGPNLGLPRSTGYVAGVVLLVVGVVLLLATR
jgi:hypothetical protein